MTASTNRLAAVSAAATALLLLAGCGSSTPTTANPSSNPTTAAASHSYIGTTGSMPTSTMSSSMMGTGGAMASTGGMSTAGMPMPAQPAGPHNQADITFAQQMTVHHTGAIAMADLAPTRAASTAVKTLAAQIKTAQAPEIKQMAGWLAAWAPDTDMNGMPNSTAASMGGMGTGSGTSGATSAMPGMMSDAQMAALTAATGPAFDKLFLQMMIAHHQGALTMATTETAQGQNPAALALAKSITTTQTAQITQMQDMLKTM